MSSGHRLSYAAAVGLVSAAIFAYFQNWIAFGATIVAAIGTGLGWRILKFARGEDARYASLWRPPPLGLFQPFATTEMDRYPQLFTFARDRLGDGPDRRILSFGCSTGEEVFSLRRYFPQAQIRGIDINPRNIARAQARLSRMGDDRLSFTIAASAAGEGIGNHDAVFAMAVFRHGELGDCPPTCSHLLHFAEFEQSLMELSACLKPGGLLFLRHANFRFQDTVLAQQFDLLLERPRNPRTPIYDVDEALLPSQPALEGVAWRKCAGPGSAA